MYSSIVSNPFFNAFTVYRHKNTGLAWAITFLQNQKLENCYKSVVMDIFGHIGRCHMKNSAKRNNGTPYPEMIITLPEIDIPLEAIRGWLLQAKDKQVVFFDIQPGCEVPPHSHCAQWGFVMEGEAKMVIGGKSRVYRKGDWYFIPEGVVHSATFPIKANAIDVFDDPQRYSIKKAR
jgi:mannose-6-phosphate isomerase-like protein (cupin superfamily)